MIQKGFVARATTSELEQRFRLLCPDAVLPTGVKSQMLPYQMLALYGLARHFNYLGARILEIGTGWGTSAAMLSQAAPEAEIWTVTPNRAEADAAQDLWRRMGIRNVCPIVQASWDYWQQSSSMTRDMVFVDGDHNAIRRDMVWWNCLRPGGLFVCHDYSPADSAHPSPLVFETLNEWRVRIGRDFDVLVVDDTRTGLAGWYRRCEEVWA